MKKIAVHPKRTVIVPGKMSASKSAADDKVDLAFDEEDPWPLLVASILDLCESTREQSAKSTTQRRSTIKETNSVQHLMSSVEHGEVHDHATQ